MLRRTNTMKLLAILAVLVGVFLVMKFTGNSNRSKSFHSELVDIDPEKVTKVEIMGEDTVVLEKSESGWVVNQAKPADSDIVKSLFGNIMSIKPSRIASRSEEQWKDFQVDDESGLRIMAYEGSNNVLDIILGRFNVEGQRSFYSYVRLADEKDTYVAKDFMKMSVSVDANSYRIDDILKVKKDSISSIDFNYPDSAFTLSRAGTEWQLGEIVADSTAAVKYLNALGYVSSQKFTEDTELPAVYDAIYNLTNGNTIQITFYGDNKVGSSFNQAEFWQDETVVEKLFKGKDYFLGEENL